MHIYHIVTITTYLMFIYIILSCLYKIKMWEIISQPNKRLTVNVFILNWNTGYYRVISQQIWKLRLDWELNPGLHNPDVLRYHSATQLTSQTLTTVHISICNNHTAHILYSNHITYLIFIFYHIILYHYVHTYAVLLKVK